MWDLAETTTPVARKEYPCGAWDWICNAGLDELDYKPEDWRVIQDAKKEGCKILKGSKYTKTSGKYDGEFSVFRARIDLDKICQDYGLYPEN